MQTTNETQESKQPAKRSAFAIMNSVRDHCKQPASKKVLMLTLATYCNGDGLCYPSNETLARASCVSSRTVKRLLRELVADGEVEILAPGIGRDKKRILCLRRYAARKGDKAVTAKQDKAMTHLNGTGSVGKASRNSHKNSHEQPERIFSTEGTNTLKAVHTFARIRSPKASLLFQDCERLTEDQNQSIRYYNQELVPLGWLPVTKATAALETALDGIEPEQLCALVDGAANGDGEVSIPKRKTLVRLIWQNY